jgi:hypothetical protein
MIVSEMNPKVNSFKNIVEVIYDRLRGIRYGKKIIIELALNEQTTEEDITQILKKIDYRMLLKFYDAFYDLPEDRKPVTRGDTGAFVDIAKDGKHFKARFGNHGGYKLNAKWTELDSEELIAKIHKSRTYNAGKMYIESRPVRKQWRENGNAKVLYQYYHDISDVNF